MISITFDVCHTPRGDGTPPVPYKIIAESMTSLETAESVAQCGAESFLESSELATCHGDALGTAGGTCSGVTGAVSYPLTGSDTVRCEGSRMIREGDLFGMNAPEHGGLWNALGIAVWDTTLTALEGLVDVMGAIDSAAEPYLKNTNESIDQAVAKTVQGIRDLGNISYEELSRGLDANELYSLGEGALEGMAESWEGVKSVPTTPWYETAAGVGAGVATGIPQALGEISSGLASGKPGKTIGKQAWQVLVGRLTGKALEKAGLKDVKTRAADARATASAANNVRVSIKGRIKSTQKSLSRPKGQRPGRDKRKGLRARLEKDKAALAKAEADSTAANARQAQAEAADTSVNRTLGENVGPELPTKEVPQRPADDCPVVDSEGRTNICIRGPGDPG